MAKERSLICIASMSLMLSTAHAGGFQITTGNDWQPFTDATKAGGGYATEIVARVVKEMKVEADISHLPWARSYELAKRAKYVATFPWYRSSERARDMYYTKPIMHIRNVAFARKEKLAAFENWSDVNDGTLCRPTGYTILEQIQTKLDTGQIQLIQPPEMDQCFRMLAAGRVDYVITSRLVGWATVKANNINSNGFAELGEPIEVSGLHVLVSKKHPQAQVFLKAFNESLMRLNGRGELDQLRNGSR
ncbi:MAG: transporter substrate-binding domain-containing protein [Pseudomonadota bacterium]